MSSTTTKASASKKRAHARRRSGYATARRMFPRAPWRAPVDPVEGVVIHDPDTVARPLAAGVDGFAGRTK
jgi:NTE family protein